MAKKGKRSASVAALRRLANMNSIAIETLVDIRDGLRKENADLKLRLQVAETSAQVYEGLYRTQQRIAVAALVPLAMIFGPYSLELVLMTLVRVVGYAKQERHDNSGEHSLAITERVADASDVAGRINTMYPSFFSTITGLMEEARDRLKEFSEWRPAQTMPPEKPNQS